MRLLLLSSILLSLSPCFAQAGFYPTESSPDHVAIADFDRDGYPDMAAITERPSVDVFFNDHNGGFGQYTSYAIPSSGPAIAVDINGDGWPDILIAPGSGSVSTVLINNGNGTFHVGTAPATKMAVSSFAAGDFNRDGKVDLLAFEGKQIEVLLNKGSGTFASGQILALSGSSGSGVVADFDGDGFIDIANNEGAKALVWWGKGDGTFAAPAQIQAPTSEGFHSLTSADFNNDGLPDLALSSNGGDSNCDPNNGPICGSTTAHVYKNLGGRKFSSVSLYTMGPAHDGMLFAADLNGDLTPDLVNLFNAAGVYSGDLSYRAGNGNGTFGNEVMVDSPSATEVKFRDLNLDSRQDIVLPEYFSDSEVVVELATSGFKNCSGTSSASLRSKICAPANNATVSSPVLVTAAGNSPIGVQRLEIWVDGKKVYQKLGDQLNKRITLSAGQHRLVVVAVDKYVGTASTVETVNVK